MTSNLRDQNVADLDRQADAVEGLSSDELRAEQAGELPDREAMSILDVGDIGAGLPTPELIEGIVGGELGNQLPVGALPVEGVPSQPLPPDQIPIDGPVHTLPIEPIDTLPEQPIGIPDLPDVTAGAEIDV